MSCLAVRPRRVSRTSAPVSRRRGRLNATHSAFATHRLLIALICAGDAFWTCFCSPTERMNVVAGESMNSQSQILFNKTLEEARRLGARGGRAHARNVRARSALLEGLRVTPS